MGGFGSALPTSGPTTATFDRRIPAPAAALPPASLSALGLVDYAISGDSMVKFGERMRHLALVNLNATGGAGLRAVDTLPVPAGQVWLVLRISRVSSITHGGSAYAVMHSSVARRFENFAATFGTILSAEVPGLFFGGTIIGISGTAGAGEEVTVGSAQLWAGKFHPLVMPEGTFIRYIANPGGASSAELSVYGVELNLAELSVAARAAGGATGATGASGGTPHDLSQQFAGLDLDLRSLLLLGAVLLLVIALIMWLSKSAKQRERERRAS